MNDKGDEIAQMATQYTPNEIAYFRQLASHASTQMLYSIIDATHTLIHIQVEQIMTAPNETFCLNSLAALREVGNLVTKGSMTKAQAEVVLQSFVAQGWLLKSRQVF